MQAARFTAPVVLPCDAACSVLRDGVVDVDGTGRITHVGPRSTAPPSDGPVHALRGVLLPGLINTHAHTPMLALRGAGGDDTRGEHDPGWDRLGTWEQMRDDISARIDADGLVNGRVELGYGPHSAYTLPPEALAPHAWMAPCSSSAANAESVEKITVKPVPLGASLPPE